MTRFRFIELIKQPASVEYEEMDDLKDITEQFPYFQSSRLLYAKALFEHKSYQYNDELKRAAAYAADRKILYHLIHHVQSTPANESPSQNESTILTEKYPVAADELVFEERTFEEETPGIVFEEAPESIKTEAQQIPVREEDDEEQPVIFEEKIIDATKKEETVSLSKSEEAKPLSAAEILSQRLRELENPAESTSTKENDEPSVNSGQTAVINENAKANAIQDKPGVQEQINYIKDVSNSFVGISDKPQTEEPVNTSFSTTHLPAGIGNREQDLKNTIITNQETSANKSETFTTETQSFTDWLHRFQKHHQPSEKKTSDVANTSSQEPTEQQVPLLSIKDAQDQVDASLSDEPEPGHLSAKDLVNLFIKNDPRIDGSKTKFSTPGNMAKTSSMDSSDIVSETLARIYFEQGNISRSIQTYEKLMLKFPEKSVYFAALIREIKKSQL